MPKYEIVCQSCGDYQETGWTTKYSELQEILEAKCLECKGELKQSYGNRKYLLAKDKVSSVSSKESKRREEKWNAKAQELIHEDKVSDDAYYDMRDD